MVMTALALLAGGASGYRKRQQEDIEQARQDENDAWTREERQRKRDLWKQQDQDRADQQAEKARMVQDAAPVEAKPELAPDQHGPQTWGVAGQTITDDRKVAGAVKAANMPSAWMTRMASATSDPNAAINLLAGAAKAKLDEAAMARQEKMFDILGRLAFGGEVAIPEIYKDYSDGYEAEVIPGQNGGFVVRRMKDGKPAGEAPFKDLEDFALRTVGSMNPDLYVSSMQKRREQEARAAREAAELQFRRDQLTETGRHNRSMEGLARMRAAGEGAQQQPAVLTLADLRDGHKTIAGTLNADYKTQIDMAQKPEDSAAIKKTREAEIADVQRLYTGAMTQGVALTPEQAIAAYRAGKRTTVEVPDATGKMHRIEAMMVGDRIIPFADAPGKFVESKRASAPAPAPAPSPAATPTTAPAPARPPENLQPFRAMSDEELARYVKAGNTLAIAVDRERRAAAARETASMAAQARAAGFDPGY